MASQNTDTLAFERVPDITCPIVVSTEKDAARDGKGNRSDSTKNVVVRESV